MLLLLSLYSKIMNKISPLFLNFTKYFLKIALVFKKKKKREKSVRTEEEKMRKGRKRGGHLLSPLFSS